MAKQKKPNPIRTVIEDFYDTTHNIRFLSQVYIPAAAQIQDDSSKKYTIEIEHARKLQRSRKTADRHRGELVLHNAIAMYQPFLTENHPDLLAKSLFIYAFACFDAFVGNLLREVYGRKKELQQSIEKTLNLDDLAHFSTVAQLRTYLVEKEIDSFRRDSYLEQFKALEKRLGFKTLRSFAHWPDFVEASQRRHLFTHCEGIVTKQYIATCREAGYQLPKASKIGQQLSLTPDYHHNAIQAVAEVGVKLGVVIWRKQFPEDLEESDKYLTNAVVDSIKDRAEQFATSLGEFTVRDLPKVSNEMYRRMFAINYAQALKWFGNDTDCKKVLKEYDWSASSTEFQLAVAVLTDDFGKATELMIAVGNKSDMIDKMSYLSWPLFKEFKKSEEFKATFKKVFKQDAISVQTEEASEARERLT